MQSAKNWALVLAPVALLACATEPTPVGFAPDDLALGGDTVAPGPQEPLAGGTAPNFGEGRAMFLGGGDFVFLEAPTPGKGGVTDALVVDMQQETIPDDLGTGNFDVTVGGVHYLSDEVESFVGQMVDTDGGETYLVMSAFRIDPGTAGEELGSVLHVIVPATDFAVGASVELDGVERIALFMHGDISLPDPSVVGAAVTGMVTFTAGSTSEGSTITAVVNGEFGSVEWDETTQPPVGGALAPGHYALALDPVVQIYCDGALAGQEAAFETMTPAQLGFDDGHVVLSLPTTDGALISGPPIDSAFGTAELSLATGEGIPDGAFYGEVVWVASGPVDTTQAVRFLMLDGQSATATNAIGFVGAGFLTPEGDGACSVVVQLELTAE